MRNPKEKKPDAESFTKRPTHDPVTGKFAKGNLANPGGRPAVAREFKLRCQAFMEEEGGGWDTLITIAKDRLDRDRQAALTLVAAYAYGKPTQRTELTGADAGPIELQQELAAQDVETLKAFREWRQHANRGAGTPDSTTGDT